MNLKTKHILAVSAVAGIAGAIGYFIGHKLGYERGYFEYHPEIDKMIEAPETVRKILGLDYIPESMFNKYFDKKDHKETIKELCEDSDDYEYFESEMGYGARTKNHVPIWTPNLIDMERPSGRPTDRVAWKDLHIAAAKNGYISEDDEADENDEDAENLRTQGEVEYLLDEPYLVQETEVFTVDKNPDDVDTLTYYREDDVLIDSFDEIVLERDMIIGVIDLSLFSGPAVYVRNPQTKRDYEIIIEQGSYEKEVLGADDEQYRNAVKFFKLGDE